VYYSSEPIAINGEVTLWWSFKT